MVLARKCDNCLSGWHPASSVLLSSAMLLTEVCCIRLEFKPWRFHELLHIFIINTEKPVMLGGFIPMSSVFCQLAGGLQEALVKGLFRFEDAEPGAEGLV